MSKAHNVPLKILLISDSDHHQNVFNNLCQRKEFIICELVDNIEKIEAAIAKDDYDLIIASSNVKTVDVISYFYNNQIEISDKAPLIFILQKNLPKKGIKLFEKLKINFLYEDYLDLPLLDYSLKIAIQKQKVLNRMKENQLRFKSLYEHNLDINIITDLDFIVIDTNVQGRKQLKFKEAFELKSIFKLSKEYKKFINQLNEDEQVSRYEAVLKYKKKEVVCLLDAFLLFDSSKNRSGSHIVIRDIDNEKKSQVIAIRASKLMVTGKFLRSLAHEIRNPLTNINLALEELNTEENLPKDAQVYLDVVQRSANRVTALLEEIMNAYKTAEINLQSESLHNIIENAIQVVNDRFILKNIHLKLSFKAKNDSCNADKEKLATAIANLIVNACEAITHDHGVISIGTSKKEGFLVLTIKDNGCGMNTNQTATLFDPFYTGKSKGLGLGLTTAQNAIFAHKGTISVKSKENIGTQFSVRLPYKP